MDFKQTILASAVIALLPVSAMADRYVKAELTYLERSDAEQDFSCADNCPDNVVLSAEDIDSDWESGLSLAYGWDSNRWGQMELGASYFGKWTGSRTAIDEGEDLNPIGDLQDDDDDFTIAYAHKVDYDSTLWGLHLVRKMPVGEGKYTGTVGLSYLNLKEGFDWGTLDEDGDLYSENGSYNIDTQNHMIGVVAGVDGALAKVGSNGRVVFGLLAGAYANNAKQSSKLSNDVTGSLDFGKGSDSQWEMALRLDASLGLEFDVAQRSKLGFGVKGMWLSGVALAPEQVSFGDQDEGPDLNNRLGDDVTTDTLGMWGAYVSFQATF